MSPLAFFLGIATYLEDNFKHIKRGSMLSSPALEYKGRAFAFCEDDRMILKLRDGRNDVLSERNIRGCQRYAPFGDRLISDQWIQVPFYYHLDWKDLAELALVELQHEYGS